MKASSSIKTPQDYLRQLPENRQTVVTAMHRAIRVAAPEPTPPVADGRLSCGPAHHRAKRGCEGDWLVAGPAKRKNHLNLDGYCRDDDGHSVRKNHHRLGRLSIGKSCIRSWRRADLNLEVVREYARPSVQPARPPYGVIVQ